MLVFLLIAILMLSFYSHQHGLIFYVSTLHVFTLAEDNDLVFTVLSTIKLMNQCNLKSSSVTLRKDSDVLEEELWGMFAGTPHSNFFHQVEGKAGMFFLLLTEFRTA